MKNDQSFVKTKIGIRDAGSLLFRITQEDFSDVSSRTYLSTLERGMKSPTLEKLEEIASVIGIHPVALLMMAYCHIEKVDAETLSKKIVLEIAQFSK